MEATWTVSRNRTVRRVGLWWVVVVVMSGSSPSVRDVELVALVLALVLALVIVAARPTAAVKRRNK
jgi:hypothetical protein